MIKVFYPEQKPSIKTENGREYIFCIIRKKWLFITPEEWVRQNFLLYLIHELHYPASLIAVEKQIVFGELKRRFDIVVYKNTDPFLIIECKEMDVPLSEATIAQVLNYNIQIQAPHIVVTNGSYCAAFKKDSDQFLELTQMPVYRLI